MSVNQIPASIHGQTYRGWSILIECSQPSTDALNAAIAGVDVDIEEYQSLAA